MNVHQSTKMFSTLAEGRCPVTGRRLSPDAMVRLALIVRASLDLALDMESDRTAPSRRPGTEKKPAKGAPGKPAGTSLREVTRQQELLRILATIKECGRDKEEAAKRLGMNRATLYRRIQSLSLRKA